MLDFSFDKFLTSRLIKFVYGFLVIIAILGGLGTMAMMASQGSWLSALFVPVGVVFSLVFIRVYCEVAIVLFKIEERLGELVQITDSSNQLRAGS